MSENRTIDLKRGLMNKKMATLTEESESKTMNALNASYYFLKGSDMGNGIVGRIVVEQIRDAINFIHSEKMRMEEEKEWGRDGK